MFNINKMFVVCIFLMAVMTVGAISAADENIAEDLSVCDAEIDESIKEVDDGTVFQELSSSDINEDGPLESIESPEIGDSQNESSLQDNRKDIDFNVPEEFFYDEAYENIKFNSVLESASEYNLISVDADFIDAYLDGERVEVCNSYKGYYSLSEIYPNSLDLGKHVLNISFVGNEDYKPLNKIYEFEIVKFLIDIPKTVHVNNNFEFAYVFMPGDANGILSCYADGKLFKKVKATELYNFDYIDDVIYLPSLNFNTHVIEFKYTKDSKYSDFSKKVIVNSSYNIFINVDEGYIYGFDGDNNYYYDDEAEYPQNVGCIFFELFEDMKSEPTVKIDGVEVSVKKMNPFSNVFSGTVYIFDEFSKLDLGNHELAITYNDSKYPLKTFIQTFQVKPVIFLNSNMQFYDSSSFDDDWGPISRYVDYGDGSKFILKLPCDAKGNLSLYIYPIEGEFEQLDSKWLYSTIAFENGSASLAVDSLDIGKYYAHLVYTGEDYNVSEYFCKLNVHANLSYPESMIYGENKYLVITSKKDDNTQLIISNDEYFNDGVKFSEKVNLVNGTAKVSLKKLPVGDVFLEIKYGSVYEDMIIINVKPDSKLSGGKNLNMYYGDKKVYSVKVTDLKGKSVGKGKTVTFKLGNKIYKAKTNAKGIASIKISPNPGKYKITASYRGATTSNNVVVKHVVNLKGGKVSKSAKKLTLKVTLKKGNKVLKYKKVTFKFNGKSYSVKTNYKGVAKVTIKKSVLKKLKVGKKIAYQATYLKDTVKKTVIVQK